MSDHLPRYPVYVPSKGRVECNLTTNMLVRDKVPFHLVVEPQERDIYAEKFGSERLLVLPENDRGLIFARNWIKDHATAGAHDRHWQLDDNMRSMRRWWRGRRLVCNAGPALRITEDFVDRYENVAIAGLAYSMFCMPSSFSSSVPPFYLNAHVYSCTLVLNNIPNRWRSFYNDDTDMCLQVLSDGWCTVLMNAFMVDKTWTMQVKGGNTPVYQGDGRLEMARSLERLWPHVVTTRRRFQRPQHIVRNRWRKFDTKLKRRAGVDFSKLPAVDEQGLKMTQVEAEIKSATLREAVRDRLKDDAAAAAAGRRGGRQKVMT